MLLRTVRAALYTGAMAFALGPMEAATQALLNHVPHAVTESLVVGPVAETAKLTLAIGLPIRNSAQLDLLVEQIADPQSGNYRQYLTAAEFAERFGPTPQDYEKLIGFAQQNGLTVSGTHANRMLLDVTGTVGAINKMLHINLTVWNHPTRGQFFAPDRDPSLDSDVQVLHISGLDNFLVARPMDLKLMSLSSALPLVTGSGPAGLFIGNDFRAAYAPGVSLTGAGQKIALVEFDGFYAADVVANFKQAGLPAVPVSTVLLDGFNGAPGSGNIEVILDIVMAGYMAPGASIAVYEGYYPDDVLNRIATDNSARQVSCSWGYGIDSATEQIFKEMIAQGQSFFTASGDSGAYSSGVMPPADDPNVTSVGGTALNTTSAGGAWLSESAWSGSGGGISTTYPIPSYQQGMNMAAVSGSDTMRNVPDVALTGAVQMFLIYSNGAETAVGGTSAATPLWTAFTSLANQQAAANSKPAIGFMNPTLYAIGNNASTYAAAIHDITTGNTGFAAYPGYDLTTGWGSPAGQSLINDLSALSATASFTLTATPNPASVQPGASTTSTIQVNVLSGFSAAVTLSISGLPTGVTGTFGAFSAGRASILTLTATSAATPGTYPLSVKGVSGTLTETVALSLVVTGAPSYTLTTSAAAVTAVQSAIGSTSIIVVPASGFSSAVALTVSGLPSGVTALFNPASTTTSSILTFTASATATAGTATVTVKGTSGSLSATVVIALTVAAPSSFSLTNSTPTLSVAQGASGISTVTVTPKNGFTAKVALTNSTLPAGVTVSYNPASTSTTSVATFTATSVAPMGTSTVTITGTSGATSTSTTFSLTVNAGPSFTLAALPGSLSVVQGGSGTSTLTVTPLNGFTGTPTLTVAGLPTGVTAAFTGTSLKLTASATAATGASTLTVTAVSGALSSQATIALTVATAPSFKLSSPANVTMAAGSTGTATITITPQAGFTGTVALTATGLPTGVTASFGPAGATTTSTLTLTAATAMAASAMQITVTGTSGTLTSAVTIVVAVTAPPNFTIALTPSSLQIVQGGRATTTVALAGINGSSGNVTFSTSALPSGVTASFSVANTGVLALFTVSSSAVAAISQVNVTATAGALTHTAVLSLTVIAPTAATATVDLSPSYNVSGIAIDSLPFTGGGLDASGRSYSGTLLGSMQTIGGTVFALGPMGLPDAVSGQTVTLPADQFTSLKMLATGVNGNEPTQRFTVTYTDGTTTTITQSMSDWSTPQNYSGESKAMTMNYRDISTGITDGEVFYLYSYSFALNSAKTVRSITLPQNRNVVVLAITLAGSVNAASTAPPAWQTTP
jgi:subtilase family serine protease